MAVVNNLEALRAFLMDAQARRETRLAFAVESPLASSLSARQLRDLLDLLLPMAQERAVQLRRERGGCWRVTVRLRYRLGVRLADGYARYRSAFRNEDGTFDIDEWGALQIALRMVKEARQDEPDPHPLARRLFDAVRAAAAYKNPPLGSQAYEQVVSAAGALLQGQANCQGFSDAYYLLGSLAGLEVGYRAGFKGRAPHLWNILMLDGCWQTVDVTSGLFPPDAGG